MSEFYELGTPDWVTVGTVGDVGQRAFYLQARAAGTLCTLKIEKLQVAALSNHLGELLQDLARPSDIASNQEQELESFADENFVVGSISVAYDVTSDRIMMHIESRPPEEGEVDEARFALTREQAAGLAIRGAMLVESGRPPCPLCGYPLDPRGHSCPRTNGHQPPTL